MVKALRKQFKGSKLSFQYCFYVSCWLSFKKFRSFNIPARSYTILNCLCFNSWIKLPKQATGLNLIIKLNVFIFISCSRGYFHSKPVKLACKLIVQLLCEFCSWFCKSLKNSFIIAIFLLIILSCFAPEELSGFLMEMSEEAVIVTKLK